MFSKESCLRSARFIIDKETSSLFAAGGGGEPLLRYWPIMFSIFASTLALFVHLCHASAVEEQEAADMVRQGISLLE